MSLSQHPDDFHRLVHQRLRTDTLNKVQFDADLKNQRDMIDEWLLHPETEFLDYREKLLECCDRAELARVLSFYLDGWFRLFSRKLPLNEASCTKLTEQVHQNDVKWWRGQISYRSLRLTETCWYWYDHGQTESECKFCESSAKSREAYEVQSYRNVPLLRDLQQNVELCKFFWANVHGQRCDVVISTPCSEMALRDTGEELRRQCYATLITKHIPRQTCVNLLYVMREAVLHRAYYVGHANLAARRCALFTSLLCLVPHYDGLRRYPINVGFQLLIRCESRIFHSHSMHIVEPIRCIEVFAPSNSSSSTTTVRDQRFLASNNVHTTTNIAVISDAIDRSKQLRIVSHDEIKTAIFGDDVLMRQLCDLIGPDSFSASVLHRTEGGLQYAFAPIESIHSSWRPPAPGGRFFTHNLVMMDITRHRSPITSTTPFCSIGAQNR